MMKVWKMIRGYKRHAGAAAFAVLGILRMFGVDIDPELERNIALIGTLVWGVGWIDKGKRVLIKGDK